MWFPNLFPNFALQYVSSDCLLLIENVYPLQVQDYNILIIGIPNVGKSSIINALRQTHLGKGTAVYCI